MTQPLTEPRIIDPRDMPGVVEKVRELLVMQQEAVVDAILDPETEIGVIQAIVTTDDLILPAILQRAPLPKRALQALVRHPNRFIAEMTAQSSSVAIADVIAAGGHLPAIPKILAIRRDARTPEALRLIALAPGTDEATLRSLLRERPEIEAELLREIAKKSNSTHILIILAESPKADAKLLAELAGLGTGAKRNRDVIAAVAANPNSDEKTLRHAASVGTHWTIKAVIENESTPLDLLCEISTHQKNAIKSWASEKLTQRLKDMSGHDKAAFAAGLERKLKARLAGERLERALANGRDALARR